MNTTYTTFGSICMLHLTSSKFHVHSSICPVSGVCFNVYGCSTLKQIVQSTINPVTRCWDASGVYCSFGRVGLLGVLTVNRA